MNAVRMLIVAHAPLASALREAALHTFPDCAAGLQALDVPADASREQTRAACRALLQAHPGEPMLVLVDVAGASPANALQAELAAAPWARALAGVNVAMLWRSICYRHEGLEALMHRATEGAQRGVQGLDAIPGPLS
jgi:PTS system ascorbate-specific IIA component